MLDLRKFLTPEDNDKIEKYITTWGVKEYIGNEKYLENWASAKRKLFHLFGGKFIISIPFEFMKSEAQLKNELINLFEEQSVIDEIAKQCRSLMKENSLLSLDEDNHNYGINLLFNKFNFANNIVPLTCKIKFKNSNKILQLQKGMKIIKAYQKLIEYLSLDIGYEFEQFRIKHSIIFNEKKVKGNLCLSIHPLDYLTMSDNNSNWSSCMSWKEDGSYRIGTVEMMNSNNAICCYIESSTPYYFTEEKEEKYTWSNKKWRQLFFFNKDIIVSSKAYPYHNKDFTLKILDILTNLAKKNLNWDYEYGPELYQDMKHISSLYRMDRNKNWLKYNLTTKKNILFDTKGMFNDILNSIDPNNEFWCVRNKVKKMKIISLSGKSPCACCSKPTLEERIDYNYYDEDAYNNRYYETSSPLCGNCLKEHTCNICGETSVEKIISVKGISVCKRCFKKKVYICPDCGEPFIIDREPPVFLVTDKPFALQDYNSYKENFRRTGDENNTFFSSMYCCDDCEENINNLFKTRKIYMDNNRSYYSWQNSLNIKMSKKIYSITDDIVQHYALKNLKFPIYPEN